MHKPTHAALRVKSGKSGKVYDTRGVRWYIREKKLDAGYLQYNLYVAHEENGGMGYRNKGRILRVINRKKNARGVELCCDTGSYMVTLVKAIPEKFPPELKAELSAHEDHAARNALFCSKQFKVFYLVWFLCFFSFCLLFKYLNINQVLFSELSILPKINFADVWNSYIYFNKNLPNRLFLFRNNWTSLIGAFFLVWNEIW